MAIFIDALVILIVGLGILAEARRGLFFALSDVFRLTAGVVVGFAAYSVFHRLFHSYAAGFVALIVAALTIIMLVPMALRLLKADPTWGRTFAGRCAAGFIGLGFGLVTAAQFVPVIGRSQRGSEAVMRSFLARPLAETAPALYYVADALNLDFPMLRRAVDFEDEGRNGRTALVERINYTRLDRSTCIECETPVRFDGYFRRVGVSVSPRFTCPQCGRRSDGCQTFEGFHKMYARCPVDVSEALGPIDCGVWPNDRPVHPKGDCPVCSRSIGGK